MSNVLVEALTKLGFNPGSEESLKRELQVFPYFASREVTDAHLERILAVAVSGLLRQEKNLSTMSNDALQSALAVQAYAFLETVGSGIGSWLDSLTQNDRK